MLYKLCCLLLVAALAHGLVSPPPDYAALQAELDANRALWDASVGNAYQMNITRSCFCLVESLGPFTLTVEDGEITSVEPDNDFTDGLPTIDGVFDFIQEAIDEEAAAITVSYDATLGYPTDAFVDRDFRIADEEMGFTDISVTLLSGTCDPTRPNYIELARRTTTKSRTNGFSFFRYIRALRKWTKYLATIDCDYTYALTRSCFCLPEFVGPFEIAVVDSAVTSAVFQSDGQSVPADVLEDLPTITELFDIIFEEAMDADAVEIEYDSDTGVPTRAFFDRISGAIDDEITYLAELL